MQAWQDLQACFSSHLQLVGIVLIASLFLRALWRWRTHHLKLRRGERPYCLRTVQTPQQFEHWAATFFSKQDAQATLTHPTKDGGFDILLKRRRRIELVECKFYTGTVPIREVRAFLGVVTSQNASRCYLVTTGKFTRQAETEMGGQTITWVDGVGVRHSGKFCHLLNHISQMPGPTEEETMIIYRKSIVLSMVCLMLLMAVGCGAATVRNIRDDVERFEGRQVTLSGKVTETLALPFIHKGAYQIDDGTGKIWVIPKGDVPARGDRMVATGRIRAGVEIAGKHLGVVLME